MGLTLSGQEIKDLAEYCGFQIVPESIEQDFLDGDFHIEKCPAGGVASNEGVALRYGHVVTCDGCEGDECMPLGECMGEVKQINCDKRCLHRDDPISQSCTGCPGIITA
jgi:hypothetical protein